MKVSPVLTTRPNPVTLVLFAGLLAIAYLLATNVR
jgi:hypothetical protein